MCPPRQAAQVGPETNAPALTNSASRPSSIACSKTLTLAGTTIIRTPGATLLALHYLGGDAQVLDAAVGARPQERLVDLDVDLA